MSLFETASLVITPNGIKEDKLYAIKPTDGSGDLVVTRATTATRVNSAGLIEVVPRNLLTYSNTFSNTAWTKDRVTVASSEIISPDGTANATKLMDTLVGNNAYRLYNSLTLSAQSYTQTFYAKSAEYNWVYVRIGNSLRAWFNISNGTLGTIESGLTASISPVNDGWYKITCTITTATAGSGFALIGLTPANGIDTYTPTTSAKGIYIYGVQLDQGTTATEYFPTTTRLNIPRIDYTNGSCPSILVEPQRTNLLTYSNTFSNAAWIKLNCSVASNSIISPDGTQNSTTLTSSVTNTNFLYNAITTANGLYTLSCFVKYLDTNTVNLSMTDFATGDASAKFNFNTGLFNTPIVSGSWTNTTTNVITLTNGWFKISITSQKNAGLSVSSRIDSFAVGKSVYIWGAQLEAGANATSYIATVASTVTRNADVISKTGISSLIGQTEGTLYTEIRVNKLLGTASRYVFHLSDGTANNRIYIAFSGASSNVIRARIFSGGTLQCSINTSAITTTGTYKLAMAYKNNDIVFYINGTQVGVDTTATIPTCSRVDLGHNQAGISQFNDGITSAIAFKTRLTNAELATLTTL